MRVLIVAARSAQSERIRRTLVGYDLVVDVAGTAPVAEEAALAGGYHVLMIALSLPDISGLDVCRKLRTLGVATPIVVLGGASAEDRKRAVNAGAQGYLAPPYRGRTLLRHVLEAAQTRDPPPDLSITHGDLVVHLEDHTVTSRGAPVALARKEFQLLELLARERGHLVRRTTIEQNLWPAGAPSDNALHACVSRLRRKLQSAGSEAVIEAAVGDGYRLAATRRAGRRE